jgi:hypothetical protein
MATSDDSSFQEELDNETGFDILLHANIWQTSKWLRCR